jgi:hypothetical protein
VFLEKLLLLIAIFGISKDASSIFDEPIYKKGKDEKSNDSTHYRLHEKALLVKIIASS